jgi:hypothetical protein
MKETLKHDVTLLLGNFWHFKQVVEIGEGTLGFQKPSSSIQGPPPQIKGSFLIKSAKCHITTKP